MADTDHADNPTPAPEPSVAIQEHATPRKRAARREHEFQDDVPHHAAARTQPSSSCAAARS